MFMRKGQFSAMAPLALVALLAGCSDSDDGASSYYDGQDSAKLGSAANEARCATCHSVDGTQAGLSGKTFKDIAYHASFKGGDATQLLDAVNACVTGWMGGVALTATDERFVALQQFLQSASDPSVTTPNPIAPEVLINEAAYEAAYAGGDPVAGEGKYQTECAKCHGSQLDVGSAKALSITALSTKSVGRIAQQVRTSGPPPSGTADSADSTPGPMPFFEPTDLSATDLKDIIAYVKKT